MLKDIHTVLSQTQHTLENFELFNTLHKFSFRIAAIYLVRCSLKMVDWIQITHSFFTVTVKISSGNKSQINIFGQNFYSHFKLAAVFKKTEKHWPMIQVIYETKAFKFSLPVQIQLEFHDYGQGSRPGHTRRTGNLHVSRTYGAIPIFMRTYSPSSCQLVPFYVSNQVGCPIALLCSSTV